MGNIMVIQIPATLMVQRSAIEQYCSNSIDLSHSDSADHTALFHQRPLNRVSLYMPKHLLCHALCLFAIKPIGNQEQRDRDQ